MGVYANINTKKYHAKRRGDQCRHLLALLAFVVALGQSVSAQAPTPRASYLAFEAVAINATDFNYRPSVGFRGSGNFAVGGRLYLREQIETDTEFKVASGEGRYFASRTTLELDVARPSDKTAVSILAGFDVSHFGNPTYSKTAVRARAGVAGRWIDPGTGTSRLEAGFAIIVPLHDPNKLWGLAAQVDGFYAFRHSFLGVTGGVGVTVANAKDSFTPRRGWGEVFNAHAGITINLSAIAGS